MERIDIHELSIVYKIATHDMCLIEFRPEHIYYLTALCGYRRTSKSTLLLFTLLGCGHTLYIY
jgi:hypothetical protein